MYTDSPFGLRCFVSTRIGRPSTDLMVVSLFVVSLKSTVEGIGQPDSLISFCLTAYGVPVEYGSGVGSTLTAMLEFDRQASPNVSKMSAPVPTRILRGFMTGLALVSRRFIVVRNLQIIAR